MHHLRRHPVLALMAALAIAIVGHGARAEEIDQNDPAVRKANRPKMTQEQLIRIRIAELEGGAIAESMKTPDTVALVGPPLTEREKAVHALNRLSFGARPGQVEEVMKAGGWEKWLKQQMEPDKVDDSKLDALLTKKYAWRSQSMPELAKECKAEEMGRRRQYELRKQFRESILLRASLSNRQFKEVMCEFWRNHFCVDTPDNDETARAWTAPDYEEKVIRAHVFGKFKQMLFASATHPCMLEYLDNFKSRARNWNENYAREVMELHTLGADRFYNETDVLELSKVLTGWTYDESYKFIFRSDWHQPGAKQWLGMSINPGYEGGEQALYLLATHRGTADYIAFKLCRYLVNDNPPQALVTKAAATFRSSDGDLAKVYSVIVNSPEFMQRANYRAKFKTPFHFTVSALRATDATLDDGRATLDTLAKMGQPVYNCKDPTGYYFQAEAWRDAGVLTSRWDYAWKMVRGQVAGVRVSSDFLKSYAGLDNKALIERLTDNLIGSDIGTRTLELLRKSSESTKLEEMVSILLGSPSFQQE